jgi:UDP-glucose 4-epimerase
MKKILVTGANGYLGAQICQYLAQNGHKISGLCFPEIPNNKQWKSGFEKLFACDIRDTEKLRQIAENQFDVLVHLVSLDHHQSNGEPDFVNSVNVNPTWNLLDIFTKKGLKKFIYLSTIHVYVKNFSGDIAENHPVNCANFYALTHFLSENICQYYAQNSETECITARLSNSYGEPVFSENNCWWLAVNDLCKMAVEQRQIVLHSDGSPLRDFINGKDVCQAVAILIDKGKNGKTYHISSGETFSIWEIAQKVRSIYQKIFGENLPICSNVIFRGNEQSTERQFISRSILNTEEMKPYKIDNSELKKLGFLPRISLEKGIENLFGYLSKKL